MSKIFIVILITEGEKSYTEVNYFSNIYHFKTTEKIDNELIAAGFHKASKERTFEKNSRKLKNDVLAKIDNLSKGDEVIFHCISDLEEWVEDSKQAMENAFEKIIEEIKGFNTPAQKTFKKQVFFKGKAFEDVIKYYPVKEVKTHTGETKAKPMKKGPDKTMFTRMAEEKKLFDGDKIDTDKFKNYFKDTELSDIINDIIEHLL